MGEVQGWVVAKRDIAEEEEIAYDYGIRNKSCMTSLSPKKTDFHKTFSCEAYRNFWFLGALPVKKLPNHLKTLHPNYVYSGKESMYIPKGGKGSTAQYP